MKRQCNHVDTYSLSLLFRSNAFINFIISPKLKPKVESLFSVSKVIFIVRELLLTTVQHCLLKKTLNKFGGILEPFAKVSKIDQ